VHDPVDHDRLEAELADRVVELGDRLGGVCIGICATGVMRSAYGK
jgi:hypothetical protein